jgi:hypothetical protein
MSERKSRLPANPSIEQLHKRAKNLLRDFQSGLDTAIQRFQSSAPGNLPDDPNDIKLAHAQLVVAREYGFGSWARLVHQIQAMQPHNRLQQYELIAADLLKIYNSADFDALERLNSVYLSSFTVDRLRANVAKRLGLAIDPEAPVFNLTLEQAGLFIASLYGFGSWDRFAESINKPGRSRNVSNTLSAAPPFYKIDYKNSAIEPRSPLSDIDWDTIFGVIDELGITELRAAGSMTDAVMARLPELTQLRRLKINGGSTQLTDAGLMHLAQMPNIEELDLAEYPGGRITDRGLEFLQHLPNLKSFMICWQSGISDAGLANLRFCDNLESVDLLGTPTGDGAIKALVEKPKLRRLKTGRFVTDQGLSLLRHFPIFREWRGGPVTYSLTSPDAEPTMLLLDGPITNEGLRNLAELDGLFGLSFFWHISELTSDGLKSLTELAQLGFLGCESGLCDDSAMEIIGRMPRLRMLMGQGTVATDDGFRAFSRSQSIEYIWGRESYNLGGRGFAALAGMPALKGLAVSCKNVDDESLSTLPSFPALRELIPMDVQDSGFKHIGRCQRLEKLTCMYCRDTGDAATEHIASLNLKTYYAGSTKITDRSLEILGQMMSLERIDLSDCTGVTDAGLAFLVNLPKLREVYVGGSSRVTRDGMSMFPQHVRTELFS